MNFIRVQYFSIVFFPSDIKLIYNVMCTILVVHSLRFDICIHLCNPNPYHNNYWTFPSPHTVPSCSFPVISCSNPISQKKPLLYRLSYVGLACPRTSYKWDHIICTLFHKTSFFSVCFWDLSEKLNEQFLRKNVIQYNLKFSSNIYHKKAWGSIGFMCNGFQTINR